MRKGLFPRIVSLAMVLFGFTSLGYASETITITPKQAKINGSIKYSVIGKYRAEFDVFKGVIGLDEKTSLIKSVYLEIQASSIRSNCTWCDKIVCSRRLLHVAKYPKIIFKSQEIIKKDHDYQVQGILEMHGIKKPMSFPFKVNKIADSKTNVLNITGHWVINRKDFGVTWNKLLDKGGVLVGDHITVNWSIDIPRRDL